MGVAGAQARSEVHPLLVKVILHPAGGLGAEAGAAL